jgi:hypothetical protein
MKRLTIAALCLVATVALGRVFVDGQQARKIQYAAGDSSLVLDLEFDEGTGSDALDSTTNGNDGVIVDALWSTDTPSGSGYSLVFDGGGDSVTVQDSASLTISNYITVSCWSKVTNRLAQYPTLLRKGTSDDSCSYFCRLVLDVLGGAVPSTPDYYQTYVTNNCNDGNWHHLAMVYDGTNVLVYVDGVQQGSIARSGLMQTPNTTLIIGENGGYTWNGGIDAVKIWNRALASNEVWSEVNP